MALLGTHDAPRSLEVRRSLGVEGLRVSIRVGFYSRLQGSYNGSFLRSLEVAAWGLECKV